MKQKWLWVIHRYCTIRTRTLIDREWKPLVIDANDGCVGYLAMFRTKDQAIRANGGSRKNIAKYYLTESEKTT